MTNKYFEKNTPPGFEYKIEKRFYIIGIVAAFAVSISCFFGYLTKLFDLYSYSAADGRYYLRDGAVIDSFCNLFSSSVYGFLGLGFASLGFIIIHYLYYRENSMSIYLMKRLPNRFERHRRALKLPVIVFFLSFALAVLLLILYFLLYMLITPEVCLPYSEMENLWRR